MMFSKWLSELHAKGEIDTEMTNELRDLVSAVLATQKKGTLNLELTVEPSGSRMVSVVCKVKPKAPTQPEVGMFYVDRIGDLHREDPWQPALPMAEIDPRGPGQIVEQTLDGPSLVEMTTGELIDHDLPAAPPIAGDGDAQPPVAD